jgi:hypothetical protein
MFRTALAEYKNEVRVQGQPQSFEKQLNCFAARSVDDINNINNPLPAKEGHQI